MDELWAKRVVRVTGRALLAWAVIDAVRNRRSHGEVFGFIPYDFRIPTVTRTQAHTWSPASPRILLPTNFGVGWSLNLGRLARLAHLT